MHVHTHPYIPTGLISLAQTFTICRSLALRKEVLSKKDSKVDIVVPLKIENHGSCLVPFHTQCYY